MADRIEKGQDFLWIGHMRQAQAEAEDHPGGGSKDMAFHDPIPSRWRTMIAVTTPQAMKMPVAVIERGD
ncbi:hypothetical protein SAHY_08716 [Salinisphaera hydrothermalis EPR70]